MSMNFGPTINPQMVTVPEQKPVYVIKSEKTLRDKFALEAMKCALNNLREGTTNKDIAISCYNMADAMLEARGGAA